MNVAIVDDMKEMLKIIHSYVVNNKECIVSKCDCFQKPQYLLEKVRSGKKYDLYILDIKMPEINGLDLARKIRNFHNSACIVFVTLYREYAVTSYDIQIRAFQYIMKDQIHDKLPKIVKEISKKFQNEKKDYYIIENKLRYDRFKISGIKYIYKEEKNSIFVTQEGIYKERNSLKKVMELLKRQEFIFMDSGRIVNINYIQKIEGNYIYLTDRTKFYVSRTNLRRVKSFISDYWRYINEIFL